MDISNWVATTPPYRSQKEVVLDIWNKLTHVWGLDQLDVTFYSPYDSIIDMFVSPSKDIKRDCIEILQKKHDNATRTFFFKIYINKYHNETATSAVLLHELGHMHTHKRLVSKKYSKLIDLLDAHDQFNYRRRPTKEQIELVLWDERMATRKALKWAKDFMSPDNLLLTKNYLTSAYKTYLDSARDNFKYIGPALV